MPVKIKPMGGKWRVVEANSGKIAKNKAGTALDGGGHSSKDAALKQVGAVNSSLERRKGG